MNSSANELNIAFCTFSGCNDFISSGGIYVEEILDKMEINRMCSDYSRGKNTVFLTLKCYVNLYLNETNVFNIPIEQSENVICGICSTVSFNRNNISSNNNFPITFHTLHLNSIHNVVADGGSQIVMQMLSRSQPNLSQIKKILVKNISCKQVYQIGGVFVSECNHINVEFELLFKSVPFLKRPIVKNCFVDREPSKSLDGVVYTQFQKIDYISEIPYFCYTPIGKKIVIPMWGIILISIGGTCILFFVIFFLFKRIKMQNEIKAQLLLQRNIIEDFG